MEEWKEIFDGYLVSTLGNVDSLKRGKRRQLSQQAQNNGYLKVGLSINNKPKYFGVHRLVAMAFIPNPENKPEVNHINGNKTDNRVENLEWATKSENQQHAVDVGLHPVRTDENAPSAKFTNEQVRFIRDNPENLSIRQIAEMFGVRTTTISAIQLGECYLEAGGKIRGRIDKRIPDEIRAKIRELYQTGSYSQRKLAKLFGTGKTTIKDIIHENN